MKKIISLLVLATMICTFMPIAATAATTGECGDNLEWSFDGEYTLTISGMGDMWDWEHDHDLPWYDISESVQEVIIDSGVTSIGNNAFSWCENLTSVSISNSITRIGEDAFSDCESLTSIDIPNGVISIGDKAFDYCEKLESISIPKSVTNIGNNAFRECINLTNIAVDKSNSNYCSIDGNLFNKNKTTLIQYAIGKTDVRYAIPNGVVNIGDEAFGYCKSLTDITIPNTVSKIGHDAFQECTNLSNIIIPNSITSIGNRVFSNCTSLTSIIIPDSVTNIGVDEFYKCSNLKSVSIPRSVINIDVQAFLHCASLTDVYYGGSEAEWNDIYIHNDNKELINATIHYNGYMSDSNSHTYKTLQPNHWTDNNSKSSFMDVPVSHWAYNVINELTSAGVIDGMGDGTFRPDGYVTREQFMKLLVCALDCDINSDETRSLDDVDSNNWSAPYIFAGIDRGIYSIDASGEEFYPTDELKRGISAEWIIDGLGVHTDANSKFSDVPGSGKQSKDIAIASDVGIVSGYEDNTFRPQNTITRAEAAMLIKRIMDYQKERYSLREDSANEIDLQDNVEIAESTTKVNVPISADDRTGEVTFSNADESIKSLEKGDVLFIQPCDNFPEGFLGKVVSVNDGKNTKIKFEEPELTDVIKSVDISTYVYADLDDFSDGGDMKAVSAVKGVSSSNNGLTIDGNADAGADITLNWHGVQMSAYANADTKANVHFETESYKKKEGLYAALDMGMGAKVDIQLETENFNISNFEASADLLTNINAVAGYSNSVSKEYTYELPSCSIPVAGLFSVVIDSNLVMQADGSLTVEATADFNNDIGMKFTIDDGFTTHNNTTAKAGVTVDAEGSIKVGPKEELSLTFCGVEVMGKKFFDGISLLSADAYFGIGANGKTVINKEISISDDGISYGKDGELKHLCYFCIEGDIIKFFEGHVGVGKEIQDLIHKISDVKLTYTFADIEDKISEWHLSTGDGYVLEFELQKCPHYEYIEEDEEDTKNEPTYIVDSIFNAYKSLLNQYEAQKEWIYYPSYCIYDIDKDGIPELIITDDSKSSADTISYVYTYDTNGSKYIGEFASGHADICSVPDGNGVLVLYQHMGYETAIIFSINDGVLSQKTIIESKDCNQGFNYYFDTPSDIIKNAHSLKHTAGKIESRYDVNDASHLYNYFYNNKVIDEYIEISGIMMEGSRVTSDGYEVKNWIIELDKPIMVDGIEYAALDLELPSEKIKFNQHVSFYGKIYYTENYQYIIGTAVSE